MHAQHVTCHVYKAMFACMLMLLIWHATSSLQQLEQAGQGHSAVGR
jgi:hypothetical protein